MALPRPAATTAPPDPAAATSLDELVGELRRLKIWAGSPSYEAIKHDVNAAWTVAGRPAVELVGRTTVVDCFRVGRQRLNTDLVLTVVRVLCPEAEYVQRWRESLRAIADGVHASVQVSIQEALPANPPGFVGRVHEMNRMRRARRRGERVFAVGGMAGVGKTMFATRAALRFAQDEPFDRTFFVDLCGFHTDPAKRPADPAAVLEAFLRMLDVPAGQMPHDLAGRVAAWRQLTEMTRSLVVLDNATDENQIEPLLATGPGCLTVITSRRRLTGLPGVADVELDVFAADESERYLSDGVRAVPVGSDPRAVARIADRCGHLPLALSLVAGHIRSTEGWTLTDHAERLGKRHAERRLDTEVELALGLSYQHLAPAEQRLCRLLALHPGDDFDAFAAAALTGTAVAETRQRLRRLASDHMLLTATAGRFGFHDLVRAYVVSRAEDDEPPSAQRAAVAGLFDFYRTAATAAISTLFPAEAKSLPGGPAVAAELPDLGTPHAAKAWLTAERHTLVVISGHTLDNGRPEVTVQLSNILFRFLDGGYHADALTVHAHACDAAERIGDAATHAHALTNLGTAYGQVGRYEQAGELFRRALPLFQQADDLAGQVRTLNNLGNVDTGLGRYLSAIDHFETSLSLSRPAGDPAAIARALGNLGNVEVKLGRYRSAIGHLHQVIDLCRRSGDRTGEARALFNLGTAETHLGRLEPAADHLRRSALSFAKIGNRTGQGWALVSLGRLHTQLRENAKADELHRQALVFFRDTGDREGEAAALNGLGHAATASGAPAAAIADHDAAHTIAAETGNRYGQADAEAGRGAAQVALGALETADRVYRRALAIYRDIGVPEAVRIEAELAALARQRGQGLRIKLP